MGERGRELDGLERSLDNCLLVVCGRTVVVVAAFNVTATNDVATVVDVAAAGGVVVVVGAIAAIVVWVQRYCMRACTILQSHLVSVVVTLRVVYVIVTSECIHLYFLCIVTRCLFHDVFVMYLSHVMP